MTVRRLPWLFPRLVIAGALAGVLALAPATLRAGAANTVVSGASPVVSGVGRSDTDGPHIRCERREHDSDTERRRKHRCHATFTAPRGAVIGIVEFGPDAVIRSTNSGPIGVQLDEGYILLVFDPSVGAFVRAASQTQILPGRVYAIIGGPRYLSQLLRQTLKVARGVVVGGRTAKCTTSASGCQVVSGLVVSGARAVITVAYKQPRAKAQTFITRADKAGRFSVAFPVPYRPQGKARYLLATVGVSIGGASATVPFVVSR